MEDRNEVTQRILNLTLEILYLLTGEDYIIVRKPGGRITNSNRLQVVEGFSRKQSGISGPPPRSVPCERSEEKILELTRKMMELLSGEVPIRCQDVSVYLSMEEWEYLGGHRDLYKDVVMENAPPLTSPDGSHPPERWPRPLYSQDPAQEDLTLHERCPRPLYSRDPAQEHLTIPHHDQVDGTGGHRDLYKDVGMEDHQSRLSPDDSPSGQTDGEIGFPMVASDGEPEDSMIIDTGPEGLHACEGYRRLEGIDACEGDLGPGGIDACEGHTTASSVEGYGIRIKEEPLSDEEDGVADGNLSRPIPYTCVGIKEEPPMFEEVRVPGDDAGHIKVETVPPEEDNCSTPNIYTPRDQGESSPAHIKEEPVTFLNVLDISRQADATNAPPTHTLPETLAYEVEIPVDKAPVKGPDNASLYSVRQKEDSMEILYHCPSCYKGFSSNLDLARHQVIHTVDKLFICSLCGKSFTEMSFLVKHQVIHTDLKLCVCPVCGGCFYSETSLAKHQKTHSLPLFCSTCGKCFFNKTELAIHERKHSGERPFGCHICGKHFIAKSVLNKHMLIHTSMELRK